MSSRCALFLALILCMWSSLQVLAMGSLPDASQEGLLEQFNSYASVAVFHYTVPPEITRATWEFASFQDRPECPMVNFRAQRNNV